MLEIHGRKVTVAIREAAMVIRRGINLRNLMDPSDHVYIADEPRA